MPLNLNNTYAYVIYEYANYIVFMQNSCMHVQNILCMCKSYFICFVHIVTALIIIL